MGAKIRMEINCGVWYTECAETHRCKGDDAMKKLEYTFKTDTLFKMLFVQYPELLKKLVADLLGIPFL